MPRAGQTYYAASGKQLASERRPSLVTDASRMLHVADRRGKNQHATVNKTEAKEQAK